MNGTRGQNKNKWSKRPNVSVSPLSSSLLSLLLITCHIAQPCPSILPSFFSVFFLISLSFSLSSRNFRPHFIHQPMLCYQNCTANQQISIKLSLFTLDLSLETFTFIYLHISNPVFSILILLPSHTASILHCTEILLFYCSHPPFFPHTSSPPFNTFLILTFASLGLSSPLAYFNHLIPALSHNFFIPPPLNCICLSPLCSPCPPIPLLFLLPYSPPLMLHKLPSLSLFSFPSFSPHFLTAKAGQLHLLCSVLRPESVTVPTTLQQWPPHIPQQQLKGNLQGCYNHGNYTGDSTQPKALVLTPLQNFPLVCVYCEYHMCETHGCVCVGNRMH